MVVGEGLHAVFVVVCAVCAAQVIPIEAFWVLTAALCTILYNAVVPEYIIELLSLLRVLLQCYSEFQMINYMKEIL